MSGEADTITVSAAYATAARQAWLAVTVPRGATVRAVIEASGLLEQFPEIDLETQKVGIFGKAARLDAEVAPGDRVEVYRPIVADPKTARRKRAEGGDGEA